MGNLQELIPDFEPLLSDDFPRNYEDLDSDASRILAVCVKRCHMIMNRLFETI